MKDDQQRRRQQAAAPAASSVPAGPAGPSSAALAHLDRTRAAFAALRRAYAGVLDAAHALEVDDVADACGYPSISRLLQDHVRLDRGETIVLRRHARLTHPTPLPSGHHRPPALPATARELAAGTVSDGHVRVIATTITHLAAVSHIDPGTLEVTETQLAALARDRSPAALADAATAICEQLDAHGAVPDDVVPVDELRLLRRRDGTLHGKFHFRDPVSAEAVHTALQAATPPASADGDPTATDQPAGSGAAGFADPDALGARPIEQRRAQALRDLCATALTHGPLDIDGTDEHDDHPGHTSEVDSEIDSLVEFYGPTGDYDIDLHHETADTDLAAQTATLLDDPAELDSLLEHTITQLLDQRRTAPRPTATPTKKRSRRSEPVEGGERIHLAVTIDYRTLQTQLTEPDPPGPGTPSRAPRPRLPGLGHLGSGTPIGPATARQLACDAEIIPTILGTRSEPLDIGRKTRVVTTAIRRAITIRDRHCAFPGCRRRPTACDAHHVRHWLHHGRTAVENLCLLCSYHHTLIHRSQ